MKSENNSNPEDNVEISVWIIFLNLLREWRIILAFVTLGILIATVFFFTTSPKYSVSFTAQMGKAAAQPLESTFLASRRIMLKHSGRDDEKIETTFYELDFDEKKRMTLEVKVTTNSVENTIRLAENIVATLRNDHLMLLERYHESGFTQTFFPLLPDVKNIIESKPKVNIFISGILGGCFFGVLAALVWQLSTGTRKDIALKNIGNLR